MTTLGGTSKQGLAGATRGFVAGVAPVALFDPLTQKLQAEMSLSPEYWGLVVAAPLLSAFRLRIPFSAWADISREEVYGLLPRMRMRQKQRPACCETPYGAGTFIRF